MAAVISAFAPFKEDKDNVAIRMTAKKYTAFAYRDNRVISLCDTDAVGKRLFKLSAKKNRIHSLTRVPEGCHNFLTTMTLMSRRCQLFFGATMLHHRIIKTVLDKFGE